MSQLTFQQFIYLFLYPQKCSKIKINQWESLILVLREAKLLGRFYYSALNEGCFEEFPEYAKRHILSAKIHAERQRNQVVFECNKLVRSLSEIKVVPVFLKGANYILRASENSKGRICADLDVLVKKEDLAKVEAHLKQNHWQSENISDYDEKYYRKWAHEIPPLYHPLTKTVLDIHHNIYLPISGRSPNILNFLEKSMLSEHGGLVLSDYATVLHSVIHLFMNEDYSNAFRDLVDLHFYIKQCESDDFWCKLKELAFQTQFAKELYFFLTIQMKCFSTKQAPIYDELSKHFKNVFSDVFVEQILYRAIQPKHTLIDNSKNSFARAVVFTRGHYLKMPFHILLCHLSYQAYIGLVDKIFGKFFLEKS